jgi:hypothetical protein
LPESTVVAGPHSLPQSLYGHAIYIAAPIAYGEPVIQTVVAMSMSRAKV